MSKKNNLKTGVDANDDKVIDYSKESEKRMLKKQKEIDDKKELNKNIFKSTDVHKNLYLNEDGDANIYKELFKDKFLYDHSLRSWFYWNDHYWREDYIDNALSSVSKVYSITYNNELRFQRERLEKSKDDKIIKRTEKIINLLVKRINVIQTINRKNSILKLARAGVKSLGITGDKWDQKPWTLACKNGCVDLRTGEFKNGNPGDFIKTVCPTKWIDIESRCMPWIQFLHEIFDFNEELVDYIQRLLGYCLTGTTKEDIYIILYGEHGRNGKGTLIETLKLILGELAHKVPSEFLMSQNMSSNKGPDAETFALRGKRIVWASESNKGDKLDVGRIKELSGSDTLSARAPHAVRPIQFKPTHKLMLMTNRRPRIPADDSALWHRIHVIPFDLSFVEKPEKEYERKVNKYLDLELIKYKSEILAWIVRGCLKWQKIGLSSPKIIMDSTKEYRDFEDTIGQFIKEKCIENINSKECRETPKLLYTSYKNWCAENGHYKLSKKQFIHELKSKYEFKKDNVNYFYGIELIPGGDHEHGKKYSDFQR